jgi:hypothetical protein
MNARTANLATGLAAVILGSSVGAGIVAIPATAGTADAPHDICRYEDGSGQRVCVWDAGHAGNGVGDSFIAINGGTDRARYVYISHRKAHRLTH